MTAKPKLAVTNRELLEGIASAIESLVAHVEELRRTHDRTLQMQWSLLRRIEEIEKRMRPRPPGSPWLLRSNGGLEFAGPLVNTMPFGDRKTDR